MAYVGIAFFTLIVVGFILAILFKKETLTTIGQSQVPEPEEFSEEKAVEGEELNS